LAQSDLAIFDYARPRTPAASQRDGTPTLMLL